MIDEAKVDPDMIGRASEAEALASLREFALGPIKAVFTWSEAATVLDLIEILTKCGIIEVAIRNPRVAEYMDHWEGRAEKAEAIIEAQSKALAEARATGTTLSDIAAERERQKSVEGWTADHDDGHDHQELARAAACYASPDDVAWTDNFGRALDDDGLPRPMGQAELRRAWSYVRALRWPWAKEWWKPSDTRRNLIKAAALIVAEIERLDRLTPTPENPNG